MLNVQVDGISISKSEHEVEGEPSIELIDDNGFFSIVSIPELGVGRTLRFPVGVWVLIITCTRFPGARRSPEYANGLRFISSLVLEETVGVEGLEVS